MVEFKNSYASLIPSTYNLWENNGNNINREVMIQEANEFDDVPKWWDNLII